MVILITGCSNKRLASESDSFPTWGERNKSWTLINRIKFCLESLWKDRSVLCSHTWKPNGILLGRLWTTLWVNEWMITLYLFSANVVKNWSKFYCKWIYERSQIWSADKVVKTSMIMASSFHYVIFEISFPPHVWLNFLNSLHVIHIINTKTFQHIRKIVAFIYGKNPFNLSAYCRYLKTDGNQQHFGLRKVVRYFGHKSAIHPKTS